MCSQEILCEGLSVTQGTSTAILACEDSNSNALQFPDPNINEKSCRSDIKISVDIEYDSDIYTTLNDASTYLLDAISLYYNSNGNNDGFIVSDDRWEIINTVSNINHGGTVYINISYTDNTTQSWHQDVLEDIQTQLNSADSQIESLVSGLGITIDDFETISDPGGNNSTDQDPNDDDGNFGVTGEVQNISSEDIELIENHKFEVINNIC
ncbi:MAG: hypothetical protein ACPGDB_02535 [Fusobacterium sp.]